MKKIFNEFKDFALKGNVMSLAVGVIIGSAFQGVVTSLTDNILSPIIGLFAGRNFDKLQFDAFGISLKYGAFLTSLINFFIMAFVVFILVKAMNKVMSLGAKPEPSPPAQPPRLCSFCKSEVHADAVRCPACTSDLESRE